MQPLRSWLAYRLERLEETRESAFELSAILPGKAFSITTPTPSPPATPTATPAAAQAAPASQQAKAPPKPTAPPPAAPARARGRHLVILLSFLLFVAAPTGLAVWYLETIASDQYVSKAGFAVRSEEISSAAGLLDGLSSLSGTSSSDTDILYEFIQSQELVERVQATLPLTEIYARPENDPVFAFEPTGNIEDLVDYWQRMVRINYDQGTGLIELQVHAFTPEEALSIAELVVDESTALINRLSAIARNDATRYARDDLDLALERLKEARQTVTEFRTSTRIVDPEAAVQGQLGIVNSLEAQLAEAQIDLNVLRETGTNDRDPRMVSAERRISVIRSLIEEERAQFGEGSDGQDLSTLVGEFERLLVDREYAEQSYLRAQATLDTAIAEANRQSRYLAVYNTPTLPQSSRYPDRFLFSVLIGTVLLLIWSVGLLIYYSLRDRL